MQIKPIISRTAALSAVVVTSILLPTFAQAGGRSATGPARVVLDERGAAKPVVSGTITDPIVITPELTKVVDPKPDDLVVVPRLEPIRKAIGPVPAGFTPKAIFNPKQVPVGKKS